MNSLTKDQDTQENKFTYNLSIIIPVYNEEKNVTKLISKVIDSISDEIKYQIIIIEDGSTDNTKFILEEFLRILNKNKDTIFITNEVNIGKSRSVIKGILEADSEYIVIQDADLEYDPKDINYLYSEVVSKNFDVSIGNRFSQYNPILHWKGFYGNIFLTTFFNLFSLPRIKTVIGDMHVCYKMIKTKIAIDIVKNLKIKDSFSLDTIILVKLTQYKIGDMNLKFINVPISYFPRSIEEGKKLNPLKDGLKCLFYIIRYNLPFQRK
jgi:glycosyltransferase involved in cell wall biosynthesis